MYVCSLFLYVYIHMQTTELYLFCGSEDVEAFVAIQRAYVICDENIQANVNSGFGFLGLRQHASIMTGTCDMLTGFHKG